MPELAIKDDGDPLEPRDLNLLYREHRRRRGMQGTGGIVVSGANSSTDQPVISLGRSKRIFAQLTTLYAAGYGWKEVTVGPGRTVAVTGLTGGPDTGQPAFERRTGDTTLVPDGTVFEMVKSAASNEWVFPHRDHPPCPYVVETFVVLGCGGLPLAGAVVTVSGIGSCTTDSTGTCSFIIYIPASYPWSVSASNYTTKTGTFILKGCASGTTGVTLSPATGYTCYAPGIGCVLPAPIQIPLSSDPILTDSVFGASFRVPSNGLTIECAGFSYAIVLSPFAGCIPPCSGPINPLAIGYCLSCYHAPGSIGAVPALISFVAARSPGFGIPPLCPNASGVSVGIPWTLLSYTASPPSLVFGAPTSTLDLVANLYCGATPTVTITW